MAESRKRKRAAPPGPAHSRSHQPRRAGRSDSIAEDPASSDDTRDLLPWARAERSSKVVLEKLCKIKYTKHMTKRAPDGERGQTRVGFEGQPNVLGVVLADLRKAKGLSLREVQEATGGAVSNAYLSQLERQKIKKPSPNVLRSLAEVYGVPYESLMEKAGYLMPDNDERGGRRRRLSVFAIDDLTAEEEEELLKYLAFLRFRNQS